MVAGKTGKDGLYSFVVSLFAHWCTVTTRHASASHFKRAPVNIHETILPRSLDY